MRITDFTAPATTAAPWLLGKLLCCKQPDGTVQKRRITETEAYYGETDTACHAHKGRTPRTEILYKPGGCAYVYLCYGIHSLLNVVTGPEGFPQAVLIRGVEGHSGPGRLTKALGITCHHNGLDLTTGEKLWLEDDGAVATYTATPRVGIAYATPQYRDIPWRFILKELQQ